MQEPDVLPDHLPSATRQALAVYLSSFRVQFISCIYWRNRLPWHIDPRQVWDGFFVFPVKGEVEFESGGQTYDIAPGRFIMLADGMRHRARLKPSHPELEQFSLHATLHNPWGHSILSQFDEPVGSLTDASSTFEQLRGITSLIGHNPEAGRAWGSSFVTQLIISQICSRTDFRMPAVDIDPRIAHAVERIHAEYGEAISVTDLARSCELSEVQFRKLFKKDIGQTPKAYLSRHRLQQAAELLRGSSRTIQDISDRTGFSTPQYFHLCFQEAFDCTPSEYRRQPEEV